MTASQLRAFHLKTFCDCGRKATRIVKNIGFCTHHYADAVEAATRQAIEMESLRAAAEFEFDYRRSVTRDYRHEARGN